MRRLLRWMLFIGLVNVVILTIHTGRLRLPSDLALSLENTQRELSAQTAKIFRR